MHHGALKRVEDRPWRRTPLHAARTRIARKATSTCAYFLFRRLRQYNRVLVASADIVNIRTLHLRRCGATLINVSVWYGVFSNR